MGLTKIRAAQISDIDYKQSARVLTDTNITLTGGAPLVVDGVTLLDIDRVLVKGQTNAAQNGIYRVLVPGTGSDGTWIRSSDANETGEIEAGMIIMVTEGAVYGDTQWKLITNDPIIIGVTPLVFEQNSAFAFGNIYANNTAILANVVGDTLTVTPSNNISMVGNATTKTLTLGVVASGSNSQIQYNLQGNLAANAGLTFEPGNSLIVSNANITTTQFYFGDGSQLTNIAAAGGTRISSGNSNIAIATSNGVGNVSIAGVQNVVFFTTDGISTTGNYYANTGYFAGDPNLQLWANTLITANIGTTQVVQIDDTGLEVSNLRVNVIESPDSTFVDIRDGLQASEIVLSGNIFGAGAVFDGNVTANYFYGNGALLTGIDATSIQNGTSSVKVLSSGGNIQANVAGNAVLLLTSDGANIYGNVEANYYYGNGSQLTGIEAFSNLVPQSYWLQPNIAGEFPVVANDQGLLFAVAGNGIIFDTDPSNHTITINTGLSSVDYELVTQAVTVSEDLGNVTANTTSEYDWGSLSATAGLLESLGGVIAVGDITTQANVIANYVVANVDAETLSASTITATGNISATYFLGNGSLLTGLPVQYSNANVAAYLPTYTGNLVSLTGALPNLTGNITTTARITATGNVTGGNIVTTGLVSATGNISGSFVLGNGRSLTGIYDSIAANVLPAANVTYDLGSNTLRWNDVWLSNSTIYLGDANISANGTTLVLPSQIEIGSTSISANGSTLVLPAQVEIGNTTIDGSTGGFSSLIANTVTVTANTSAAALKVTQLGSGNAFVVEDAASDTTPFIINNSGNVAIGTTDLTYKLNVGNISTDQNTWLAVNANTQSAMYLQHPAGYAELYNSFGTVGLNAYVTGEGNPSLFSQVLYFDGYNDTANANLGIFDDKIFIRGTGGNSNVGIGTTDPQFKLDVVGAINATEYYGNGQGLTGLTANNVGAIQNGNSNVAVSANGNITMSVAGVSNIVVITDTGVGFGNSAPQSRLVVQGLASNTNTPLFEYYNSTEVLKSNMTSRGAQNWFIQSGDDTERGSIRYSTPGGSLGILFISPDTGNRSDFKHKPGGGYVWGTWGPTGNVLVTAPELMWLDVNGNLSIGMPPATTSSNLTYKFQANGDALIQANTTTDALRIIQLGTGNALVIEDDTNPDATPFVVTAGGNVGIGVPAPLGYFHANVGNAAGDRMILQTNSDGGTSPLNLWNSNTGNNVGSGIVISAGGDGVTTGFIGGVSSRKVDDWNSRTLLRVLTGNTLTGLSDGNPANTVIPFYIQGSNAGPQIVMQANQGVGINTTSPNVSCALTANGVIRDDKGDVRDVPPNTQTTSYTLVIGDTGKFISTNAAVTVPNGVFSSGQSVSVYNNSAANITIVQGTSVTMYLVGTASTGNRTLAQRGLATIFCVGANTFVASGGGLT